MNQLLERPRRDLWRDEGGQVFVEYMLGIAIAISIVTVISINFRKSLFNLWKVWTAMVVPGCPGCEDHAGNNIR